MQVIDVVVETHDTKTFHFIDADFGRYRFDYHAGQYLTFRFDQFGGKPVVRSYTMSSSPVQKEFVSITVKRTTGGIISNWLYDNLRKDMILLARGAIGKFCYDADSDYAHLFMIAAGSGVTPFLSITRQFMHPEAENPPAEMSLLISQRTTRDLIGWRLLETFAQKKKFHLYLTLSGEEDSRFWHGRITAAMLDDIIGAGVRDKTFMLCGPAGMMETVADYLLDRDVDRDQIKTESFMT